MVDKKVSRNVLYQNLGLRLSLFFSNVTRVFQKYVSSPSCRLLRLWKKQFSCTWWWTRENGIVDRDGKHLLRLVKKITGYGKKRTLKNIRTQISWNVRSRFHQVDSSANLSYNLVQSKHASYRNYRHNGMYQCSIQCIFGSCMPHDILLETNVV